MTRYVPPLPLFLAWTVTFCLLLAFSCGKPPGTSTDKPRAKAGLLDLRNWNPVHDEPITLMGQWEYYPGQLLAPGAPEFSAPAAFAKIPGTWNSPSLLKPREGSQGFATYRIRIRLTRPDIPLALRVGSIPSSYVLFANGKRIISVGKVGKSQGEAIPALKRIFRALAPPGEELELVWQISNFRNFKGGPGDNIVMGDASRVHTQRLLRFSFGLFLAGSLLVMGLYHLSLFFLRKNDYTSLSFGGFCLLIGIRHIVILGEISLPVSMLTEYWILKITEGVSVLIAFPVFNLYLYSLFPREYSRRVLYSFLIFCGIILLIAGFILASGIIPFIRLAILVDCAYLLYVLTLAIIRGRPGSLIFLGGLVCLVITTINDVNEFKVIAPNLLAFGLFIFIFSQAYFLAQRFSRAFQNVQTMTKKLRLRIRRERELKSRNQELKELDRLKSEFFANMSHEFRTPLTLILTPLEEMQSSDFRDPPVPERMRAMYGAARRLLKLIQNLLELSRLESDLNTLKPTRVELVALTRNVTELFAEVTRDRGLELEFIEHPRKLKLISDLDKLELILMNLLGNAIKFTPSGKITVSLGETSDTYLIRVIDTGIGVAPGDQKVIFDRFRQVEGRAERSYEGTGIGLSLAQEFAELLGGEIRLESTPGEGSIFTLEISRRMFRQAIEEPRPAVDTIEKEWVRNAYLLELSGSQDIVETIEDQAKSSLLIIEDNNDMRSYLVELLEPDHRVYSASNGVAALKLLENLVNYPPDLILCDIMMPGLSGLEVRAKLEENPVFKNLPFIFLSARAEKAERMDGLRSGVDDYLTKPFNTEELLLKISNLINRHQGNKAALVGARRDILADFHDHLGGVITDLRLFLKELDSGQVLEPDSVFKLRNYCLQINAALRDKLNQDSDQKNLRENFIEGLRMFLFRRYESSDRRIRIHCPQDTSQALMERYSDSAREQLFTAISEISTNDLKYGRDEAHWNFSSNADQIEINFRAGSDYETKPRSKGMGENNLKQRMDKLGAQLNWNIKNGEFQIQIQIPVISE